MREWYELKFFKDKWLSLQPILYDMDICPCIDDVFLSMELTPYENVRVAIVAQDPYPNPSLAMGLALSVPNLVREALPPTLRTIFTEYVNDLHYLFPKTTDLTPWAKQGVFLWNALPTCNQWQSMSHDWEEYHALTKEIVQELDQKGVVFVFLGSVARRFSDFTTPLSESICLSHPSPRASFSSNNPFMGSRIFSTINDLLGYDPIDWKLD